MAQPDLSLVLNDMLAALAEMLMPLPASPGTLPDHGVSLLSVSERPTSIGNHIGVERRQGFAVAEIKGVRLEAVVRFTVWGDEIEFINTNLDRLHSVILAGQTGLRMRGFLRMEAQTSTLELVDVLGGWAGRADYKLLYEHPYADSSAAQSLIARIPIHADPEVPNSPDRETTSAYGPFVRWDDLTAPALIVRGPKQISGLSALHFQPSLSLPPTGSVTLLRTFDGATGGPVPFASLAAFLAALNDTAAPVRHGRFVFPTFSQFITALSVSGDPVVLGDWDQNTNPDRYVGRGLRLDPVIRLPGSADRFEIAYSGDHFERLSVVYLRADVGRPAGFDV